MSYAQSIDSLNIEVTTGKVAQSIDSLDMLLSTSEGVLQDGIVLISPANGEIDVSVTPSFDWSDSSNFPAYKIEIADNAEFTNAITAYVTASDYAQTEALLSATNYYWRVVGGNVVDNPVVVTQTTGLDSQAGDEAFLDALSASVTGFDASWNTPISLNSGSSPEGITTSLIGGGYRIIEVDLRSNDDNNTAFNALTGSIDIPEWENIKQCNLINVSWNSFDTQYPNAIHKIGANLEYLYLNYSDDQLESDPGTPSSPKTLTLHPHEYIEQQIPPNFEAGKESSQFGDNIIRGRVEDDIDNLTGLKGFVLAFPDDFGISGRTPLNVNGIEYVSENIWNINTLELIIIYECWNIAATGNTFSFPTNISQISNLKQIYFGGGSGTNWDEVDQGFMIGTYPTDMGDLTNLIGVTTSANSRLSGLPDLSGSTELTFYNFRKTDFNSESFPAFVVDGTLPEMDIIALNGPVGNPMTGPLPTTWGIPKADLFSVTYNNLTGTVPSGFWNVDMAKINLGVNNFTSIGVQDLSGLTSMQLLRYYRNDIGGEPIPYINFDDTQWNQVRIEENRYVFADMLYVPPNAPSGETAFELYVQMNNTTFSFYGQKPFGTVDDKSFPLGTAEVLFDDFETIYTHFANNYQWQKSIDGGQSWSDISGETNRELTLSNVDSNDAGFYRLQVTNSLFDSICTTYSRTTMTLTSNAIELEIT